MPHRRLSEIERGRLIALLEKIRQQLRELAADDSELLFAYRRKLAKELTYDERNKPMHRRALKERMRKHQNGMCAIKDGGEHPLPKTYCVLDRFEAPKGYVFDNVRLICEVCDRRIQAQRGYR